MSCFLHNNVARAARQPLIALFLAFLFAIPARADAPPIALKNDTYSPMHYRIRTPHGRFTEWTRLLPGENGRYADHALLVVEIWWDKDRSEQFNVRPGNYTWYRSSPKDTPAFAASSRTTAPVPEPPTAPADASSPKDQFLPLQQFIARCDEQKRPYQLSLKQLAADCARAQKNGPLPAELRYLRGFTWFFGYLIDDQNKDIILLGIKDPTRPPLDVDCLATAIKAATSGVVPYCSLDDDPDPDFSKSVVAGVPWKTRYAEVMIKADHDMGRIAQGQLRPAVPGFKSQLDLFAEILSTQGHAAEGSSSREESNGRRNYQNRWWFNFNSEVPRAIADSSGKLLYLYRNPVRLSTEQKVNGAFGTGRTTLSNRRFIESFTQNMDAIGKNYPSIAELQVLFRLYDLMKHVRDVGQTSVPQQEYWVSTFEHSHEGPPVKMAKTPASRTIKVREDVPRPVAGASYSGTETLAGYNRLTFDLHANGRATMHDADGASQGNWSFAGNRIKLTFYNVTVIYEGTWNGTSLSGVACNDRTTWNWRLTTGFVTEIWTFK